MAARIASSGRGRAVLDYIDDALRPDVTFTVPLRPRVSALVQIPVPMTDGEWEQMMRTLEAFRRAMSSGGES